MEALNNIIDYDPSSITTASGKSYALLSTLKIAIEQCNDVADEYQQLQMQFIKITNVFKNQQFQSKSCKNCMYLKEAMISKDNIINAVASQLTVLNETKNFIILDEIFKLLCGEVTTLTPKDSPKNNTKIDEKISTPGPSNESKDESVSEIEGTPTGRTSPIIQSKKLRSRMQNDLETSKKKCSNSWPTPEAKQAKLTHSTPTAFSLSKHGKSRQLRLNLTRPKQINVVDLTCTPEALRNGEKSVKPEPVDGDETIMPSPTSAPPKPDFNKYKLTYSSPSKARKPPEFVKIKTEITDSPSKKHVQDDVTQMENSINLFNPNRFKNSPSKFKKPADVKVKNEKTSDAENLEPRNDETRIDESMNLLTHYKKFEPMSETFTQAGEGRALPDTDASLSVLRRDEKRLVKNLQSPSKRPLADNMNAHNVPEHRSPIKMENDKTKNNNVRKKTPEKVEPIYKEPVVRKRAEKRALPGWSCEECKNFYSELYADDEAMLARLMEECSRHRARRAPAPLTPPGFWQPRWTVPDDTETFNARNDA